MFKRFISLIYRLLFGGISSFRIATRQVTDREKIKATLTGHLNFVYSVSRSPLHAVMNSDNCKDLAKIFGYKKTFKCKLQVK